MKNGILKSVSEEISSRIEKAHKAGQNTYGITNAVLRELKESLPWLNRNLYSHYIKHNNPPLMITANTDELQVVSSIEMPASDNSLEGGGGGRKKTGRPKGSTNDSQASSAQQLVLAKNYAAVEFDKLKKESHEANK